MTTRRAVAFSFLPHLPSAGIRGPRAQVLASLALALLCFAPAAQAQDALRMSAAGAEAAEARRKAATTLDYYNLKLGPSMWNLSAGTDLIFTDNVDYRNTGAQADFILRPDVQARILLPVSEVNSLNLNLGAGYAVYARNSQYDRFFLSPGSELSLDVYIGDWWINLHDRFALLDNAFLDPTYVGAGNYQILQNTIGAAGTWDLNELVVKLGYDHENNDALTSNLRVRDEQADLLSASAGYALRPNLRAGLEAGGGLVSYSWRTLTNTTFDIDNVQWNLGPFVEARLSDNLRFRTSVGYAALDPQASQNSLGGRIAGPYAAVTLTHRVNQYVDYTLRGGRSISISSYGGGIDMYYAGLLANWHILRQATLITAFDYQGGSEALAGAETFDFFSPRVALKRAFGRKLTAALAYRYCFRGSTMSGNGYSANAVSLNLDYRF